MDYELGEDTSNMLHCSPSDMFMCTRVVFSLDQHLCIVLSVLVNPL